MRYEMAVRGESRHADTDRLVAALAAMRELPAVFEGADEATSYPAGCVE
jgi:hypothetical protein